MFELSKPLAKAPTDKAKVKLLLKAISDAALLDDSHQRIGIISYATGYLGSILVMHDLNDWKE